MAAMMSVAEKNKKVRTASWRIAISLGLDEAVIASI